MNRIDFEAMPWRSPFPGVREKVYERQGTRLRLVEFAQDFVETGWCTRGHVGYVISGELEITFPDRTERFSAGDGVFISGDETDRHKANVLTDVARMVFVEQA